MTEPDKNGRVYDTEALAKALKVADEGKDLLVIDSIAPVTGKKGLSSAEIRTYMSRFGEAAPPVLVGTQPPGFPPRALIQSVSGRTTLRGLSADAVVYDESSTFRIEDFEIGRGGPRVRTQGEAESPNTTDEQRFDRWLAKNAEASRAALFSSIAPTEEHLAAIEARDLILVGLEGKTERDVLYQTMRTRAPRETVEGPYTLSLPPMLPQEWAPVVWDSQIADRLLRQSGKSEMVFDWWLQDKKRELTRKTEPFAQRQLQAWKLNALLPGFEKEPPAPSYRRYGLECVLTSPKTAWSYTNPVPVKGGKR